MQTTQPYYVVDATTNVRLSTDGDALHVYSGPQLAFTLSVSSPSARNLLAAAFDSSANLAGADEALAEALHSGPMIARHLTVAREAIARAEKLA